MTVLDASVVVDLLLARLPPDAVRRAAASVVVCPAHLDVEVLGALGRLHRSGAMTAEAVAASLERLVALPVERVALDGDLLREAWVLRENVALRDAVYVALARRRGVVLLTTDRRLARAVPDVAVDVTA